MIHYIFIDDEKVITKLKNTLRDLFKPSLLVLEYEDEKQTLINLLKFTANKVAYSRLTFANILVFDFFADTLSTLYVVFPIKVKIDNKTPKIIYSSSFLDTKNLFFIYSKEVYSKKPIAIRHDIAELGTYKNFKIYSNQRNLGIIIEQKENSYIIRYYCKTEDPKKICLKIFETNK